MMEVRVESEKYNPLLKRKEVYLKIKFDEKTPKRMEVREKVAGLFSVELERVVVDYIKTEFGKREAECYAKIYDSAEDLKRIEDKHILVRNFPELKKEEKKEGTA
ncbi:MAG: 30S ribosomal protein S24e [Archaeoglobaceae archaeon]